jgi:hypothetical protein
MTWLIDLGNCPHGGVDTTKDALGLVAVAMENNYFSVY